MKPVRIIKRKSPDESIIYVIQQKHILFRWMWVDACMNSLDYAGCIDSFATYEEAKKHLCYFDGSKCVDEVIN